MSNNRAMRRDLLIDRALHRTRSLARSGFDTGGFAHALADVLQSTVPHAAACVVTVDPATGLLTGTYKFGSLAGAHELDGAWASIEYGTDDPTRMSAIARQAVPAAATSHLPGGAQDSIRVRELIGPAGYADELRMMALHDDEPWGGVNLFRAADEEPFDEDDVATLAALSSTVAEGLRAGMVVRCQTRLDVPRPAGPAVLIVGEDASLQRVSVGTEDLLAELTTEPNRSPAESMVHSLTIAARRFAAGELTELPRCRLRLPSGQWLVAQAAPLASGSGNTGEVVITIDDARPPDVMPLLASAFGLTDREREVTQLVLGGTDTKGIASSLSMSTYTVQDHLKSIFDKADVRSRRELMARVFFDQYAPRLNEDVDPSGWFASARIGLN